MAIRYDYALPLRTKEELLCPLVTFHVGYGQNAGKGDDDLVLELIKGKNRPWLFYDYGLGSLI